MTKKVLSALLVLIITLCGVTPAFAEDAQARLYTVYGNGMLFHSLKRCE